MANLLIIGAGGVGSVAAFKAAQASMHENAFDKIIVASRHLERCRKVKENIYKRLGYDIEIAQVDADNVPDLSEFIQSRHIDIVLNLALPYEDLFIMEACLKSGANYVDTANYEPPDTAKFEYKWQWAFQERFKEAGLTALLGSGFDPGVTNVFASWALKHKLESIHVLDIIDCNAGGHGHPFATNFNTEINLREVTAKGRYFEHGEWLETDPLSWKMDFNFPEGIGRKNCYLMYHEELESLSKHLPGLVRARFWMTFSDSYLNYLHVLESLGLTSIEPVNFRGTQIIPLQFLSFLLPDPSTLGASTKGKTCIGNKMQGTKDGKDMTYYIYNICDHGECFHEVGSQAISYTTGVPAMIGAKLVAQKIWSQPGVWNMEQLDPDPFMRDLSIYGLPWKCVELTK